MRTKIFITKINYYYEEETPDIYGEKKFTVLIPSKNGVSNGICNLLNSIEHQNVKPNEIIIVDTGSVDGSPEILESKYPNIKVKKFEGNYVDHGDARNFGIAESSNDLVFLTSDDIEINNDDYFLKLLKIFKLRKFAALSTRQKYIGPLKTRDKSKEPIDKKITIECVKKNMLSSFILEIVKFKIPPQFSFLDSNALLISKSRVGKDPFKYRSDEDRGLYLDLFQSSQIIGRCESLVVDHNEFSSSWVNECYYINKRICSYVLGPKVYKMYKTYDNFEIVLCSFLKAFFFHLNNSDIKNKDLDAIKMNYKNYFREILGIKHIGKTSIELRFFFIMIIYFKKYVLFKNIRYNLQNYQNLIITISNEAAILINSYNKLEDIKLK